MCHVCDASIGCHEEAGTSQECTTPSLSWPVNHRDRLKELVYVFKLSSYSLSYLLKIFTGKIDSLDVMRKRHSQQIVGNFDNNPSLTLKTSDENSL